MNAVCRALCCKIHLHEIGQCAQSCRVHCLSVLLVEALQQAMLDLLKLQESTRIFSEEWALKECRHVAACQAGLGAQGQGCLQGGSPPQSLCQLFVVH